jgi:hypothetical protein
VSAASLSPPPQQVIHVTRFDGGPATQQAGELPGLNPRLRQVHQDWALGEIKRWNRGEVSVWSFRHDYFAGTRELSHVESDLFTEVVSSVVNPGISVRFLYIVRGDLRTSRGFTYQFATSTLDGNGAKAASEQREGHSYGKGRHNIGVVFELVQKLRTVRDWSLHWTALRYFLFDAEVNKWLT